MNCRAQQALRGGRGAASSTTTPDTTSTAPLRPPPQLTVKKAPVTFPQRLMGECVSQGPERHYSQNVTSSCIVPDEWTDREREGERREGMGCEGNVDEEKDRV